MDLRLVGFRTMSYSAAPRTTSKKILLGVDQIPLGFASWYLVSSSEYFFQILPDTHFARGIYTIILLVRPNTPVFPEYLFQIHLSAPLISKYSRFPGVFGNQRYPNTPGGTFNLQILLVVYGHQRCQQEGVFEINASRVWKYSRIWNFLNRS